MNIRCLFGHKWSRPYNIREKPLSFLSVFLLFTYNFFGYPKICDKRCLRCNKVKTFDYD